MTPDEINVAIFRSINKSEPFSRVCRAAGCFGSGRWGHNYADKCPTCGGTGRVEPYYIGPNYHRDLSVMHKVLEDHVPDCEWDDFTDVLSSLLPPTRPQSYRKLAMLAPCNLLAEAFLHTVGK